MRKIYQTEWHRISFKSFATLSSVQLAESAFYKSFYRPIPFQSFFERYKQWEDLAKLGATKNTNHAIFKGTDSVWVFGWVSDRHS